MTNTNATANRPAVLTVKTFRATLTALISDDKIDAFKPDARTLADDGREVSFKLMKSGAEITVSAHDVDVSRRRTFSSAIPQCWRMKSLESRVRMPRRSSSSSASSPRPRRTSRPASRRTRGSSGCVGAPAMSGRVYG